MRLATDCRRVLARTWLAAGIGAIAIGCDGGASNADAAPVSAPPPAQRAIGALGRLEPQDGIYRVAGPSGVGSVIAQLLVDKGSDVKRGQVLAVLDTVPMLTADVARLSAELDNARRELARNQELSTNKVISDALHEERETRVRMVEAELARARAELERATVRSPIDGRVLYVHAREGERVDEKGIVELGKTDHMFAIAEVYEDDVGRVRVGQRALVTSPVLPGPLSGAVDWVHLRVSKQDALGTDPAARKDARVVEVEVRLDDSRPAAGFTHLQVEVAIEPAAE
jgi:HlyD family secretion protein